MANMDFGVFLLIMLVPAALVVIVGALMLRTWKRKRALAAFASQQGYRYLGNAESASKSLRDMLEPTLFAERKGSHKLRDVLTGNYNGIEFWVARYAHTTRPISSQNRSTNVRTLLVFPRPDQGPHVVIQRRLSGAFGNLLNRFAAQDQLSIDDPDWQWALLSSPDDQACRYLTPAMSKHWQALLEQGDALLLFDGIVIFSSPNTRGVEWLKQAPARIDGIRAGMKQQ